VSETSSTSPAQRVLDGFVPASGRGTTKGAGCSTGSTTTATTELPVRFGRAT
jgi:hypothetical protein